VQAFKVALKLRGTF